MSVTTHARRLAERRCVRCNLPLCDGEGTMCESCSAAHVTRAMDWQRRNPQAHAAIQQRYRLRKREERKAAGLCIECGLDNDTSALRCSICTEKAVDGNRARRAAKT